MTGISIHEAKEAVRLLPRNKLLIEALQADKARAGARLRHDDIEGWGKHIFYAGLIQAAEIRSVLELGTYLGYGTRILAEAAGSDAAITTIDLNPQYPSFVDHTPSSIRRLCGDVGALDTIESLDELHPELVIYDCLADKALEEKVWSGAFARWPDLRFAAANWHSTGVLMRVAEERGMLYLPVNIPARDHWYHGVTLGIAWRRDR